jgi:hypothetical protein
MEPYATASIHLPHERVGTVMEACQRHRGEYESLTYSSADEAVLVCQMPVSEVIVDLFGGIKTASGAWPHAVETDPRAAWARRTSLQSCSRASWGSDRSVSFGRPRRRSSGRVVRVGERARTTCHRTTVKDDPSAITLSGIDDSLLDRLTDDGEWPPHASPGFRTTTALGRLGWTARWVRRPGLFSGEHLLWARCVWRTVGRTGCLRSASGWRRRARGAGAAR